MTIRDRAQLTINAIWWSLVAGFLVWMVGLSAWSFTPWGQEEPCAGTSVTGLSDYECGQAQIAIADR
jgi:hypothetical protein